jgi:2-keto-4-pentenoate hydratase/2-oxohepta-3-ene-1,7-dioic acid hydratase in catechol pathway
VKLCRFELHNDPGLVRSGLYHEGRFYETDGSKALGIHEPGAVRLHAPIAHAPSLRLFDAPVDSHGESFWKFSYGHSGQLEGPNDEIEILEPGDGWDFEVRPAAILSDSGQQVDPSEASKWILGYTVLILLRPPEPLADRQIGIPSVMAVDGGTAVGPFVVTPDELNRNHADAPGIFDFPFEIKVNEETAASGVYRTPAPMADLISLASQSRPVLPGDIFAWPPLPKDAIEFTPLGRGLLPTDKIIASIEGLGPLVLRLA